MRASCLALILMLAPLFAAAQGFAGLGQTAEGYDQVSADRPLSFPADHGPHPGYRIEWWYLTANLTDAAGAEYGVQFTLFRQAAAPPPAREGWASQQYWLGHIALTSKDQHLYAEKLARGGSGQAGVAAAPFDAWIDDWRFAAMPGADGLSSVRLTAADEGLAYDLSLTAEGPLALQGDGGFSVKSDRGQASYYYSQPYFRAEGQIRFGDRTIEVTGGAWMDREWSSQPLAPDQSGWDWASLHLEDGRKLMVFRLRSDDGGHYFAGNLIENGQSEALAPDEIEFTPLNEVAVAGRTLPTRWRLDLPRRDIAVTIEAINDQAWNGGGIGYWEGPVRATGSQQAIGYLEMTGYE